VIRIPGLGVQSNLKHNNNPNTFLNLECAFSPFGYAPRSYICFESLREIRQSVDSDPLPGPRAALSASPPTLPTTLASRFSSEFEQIWHILHTCGQAFEGLRRKDPLM
jgi:hypothetical protein